MERHAQLISKLKAAEEEVTKLKGMPSEKDFRNQTRQTINKKVTQICANVKRIRESSNALCDHISTSQGTAQRRHFTEYMVAYRLADEAEVGVKVSHKAAWPVAYVATQVFQKFPAIEELFQGFMHTNCPYLVPDYSGSHVGRTGPCPAQRRDEPFGDFVDRMIGYKRLWLAVAVLQEDLGAVWLWLARTLNAPPTPLVVPLIHCTLEVAGSAAQARYKRQFVKLVNYLDREYMPVIQALKARGEEADRLRASQSRLQVWISNFHKSGQAPPPEGQRIEASQEAELNPDI
jgi:nucleoporin GLE1